VTITTDQPVANPEDRPIEPTEPLHLDPPERSWPATKPHRTALGWVLGIVAIAAAAVLVAVIVDADVNAPSGGIAPAERGPTELDVRGIPTWWQGGGAAAETRSTR
jgi:hypothetical protein